MTARCLVTLLTLLLGFTAQADAPAVYVRQTGLSLDAAYRQVYEALEANEFWVVFEADLGERMAKFKDRLGADYNRSELSGARSMVFCNIGWTNAVASADPDMLALCPLHVSLYARKGDTFVVVLRPSEIARGSSAEAKARELEERLSDITDSALQ